ncbi:hypothetical protein [Novosphingobium sp. 9]|uniref:hypothetical protein n=1 Tax=Novosphingobium sp. 9 TaxID=2025349 RepID=UPI0021B5A532|nr:hypothetical protein [Novosphingobium sp. 9]
MQPHTRAMLAAATYAFHSGEKVAGLYDHSEQRDREIAAEARVDRLQGFDGDRAAKFGGILPELRDEGDQAFISFEIVGPNAKGYDRGSGHFYAAEVRDRTVQVYDYGVESWFAYEIQDRPPG